MKVTTAPTSVRPGAQRCGSERRRRRRAGRGQCRAHHAHAVIQPPVIGGKKAISRAPAIGVVRLDVLAVDRGADDRRVLEGVRIVLAARRQPGDQVADVSTPSAGVDLLLGEADALAHPGEIDELHGARPRSEWRDAGAEIVVAGVERQQRRRPRAARGRSSSVPGQDSLARRPGEQKPSATSCSVVFHLASASPAR